MAVDTKLQRFYIEYYTQLDVLNYTDLQQKFALKTHSAKKWAYPKFIYLLN
jgi:hypothetical protein